LRKSGASDNMALNSFSFKYLVILILEKTCRHIDEQYQSSPKGRLYNHHYYSIHPFRHNQLPVQLPRTFCIQPSWLNRLFALESRILSPGSSQKGQNHQYQVGTISIADTSHLFSYPHILYSSLQSESWIIDKT
jgi:hypothetical protein